MWRLELIVQCGHSILAKHPMLENMGVVQNGYCTSCMSIDFSIYAKDH